MRSGSLGPTIGTVEIDGRRRIKSTPRPIVAGINPEPAGVRHQRSLDRTGGLNKGEFLAHRNVHRSEDRDSKPDH